MYFPILKARQGELRALRELDGETASRMRPIVEVHEQDSDQLTATELDVLIVKLTRKLTQAFSGCSHAVYVDCGGAEPDPESGVGVPFSPALLRSLAENGADVAPAVRISEDERILESLAALAPTEACLRIGAEDLDDSVTPLDTLANRTAGMLDLRPDSVDLVLDFGSLDSDQALAMSSRLARFVLPGLMASQWRSVVLASGAFPVNLGGVTAFSRASFPRNDRALWVALQEYQLIREIEYGDYAVTHPLLPVGQPFAAPPQIRYTRRTDWYALKGLRTDRRGHEQFYDLCAQLLRELGPEAAAPDKSWGDAFIHDAATRGSTGPGNAATWRAIATSHHLAYVTRSLHERGEP